MNNPLVANTNPIVKPIESQAIEKVMIQGNLAALTPEQRVSYYKQVCETVGLNPTTQPFDYIELNGKLKLYANRAASEQLRAIHKVSVKIGSRSKDGDLCIVTASATMPDGRCDESIAAVNIAGLKGEALANAIMKCETKAKRRVTLSICSLGMLDETEVESIKAQSQTQIEAPKTETKQDEPIPDYEHFDLPHKTHDLSHERLAIDKSIVIEVGRFKGKTLDQALKEDSIEDSRGYRYSYARWLNKEFQTPGKIKEFEKYPSLIEYFRYAGQEGVFAQ